MGVAVGGLFSSWICLQLLPLLTCVLSLQVIEPVCCGIVKSRQATPWLMNNIRGVGGKKLLKASALITLPGVEGKLSRCALGSLFLGSVFRKFP